MLPLFVIITINDDKSISYFQEFEDQNPNFLIWTRDKSKAFTRMNYKDTVTFLKEKIIPIAGDCMRLEIRQLFPIKQ